MADNVTSPLANGIPFATDDVGGIQFPRTKISWGVDGAAVDTSLTSPFPTSPVMTNGGNLSVSSGSNFVAFGTQALKQLTLVNNTGVTIEFQQGGAGVAIPISDKDAFSIFGITNANQIGVRRVDAVATAVTIHARWES